MYTLLSRFSFIIIEKRWLDASQRVWNAPSTSFKLSRGIIVTYAYQLFGVARDRNTYAELTANFHQLERHFMKKITSDIIFDSRLLENLKLNFYVRRLPAKLRSARARNWSNSTGEQIVLHRAAPLSTFGFEMSHP